MASKADLPPAIFRLPGSRARQFMAMPTAYKEGNVIEALRFQAESKSETEPTLAPEPCSEYQYGDVIQGLRRQSDPAGPLRVYVWDGERAVQLATPAWSQQSWLIPRDITRHVRDPTEFFYLIGLDICVETDSGWYRKKAKSSKWLKTNPELN